MAHYNGNNKQETNTKKHNHPVNSTTVNMKPDRIMQAKPVHCRAARHARYGIDGAPDVYVLSYQRRTVVHRLGLFGYGMIFAAGYFVWKTGLAEAMMAKAGRGNEGSVRPDLEKMNIATTAKVVEEDMKKKEK